MENIYIKLSEYIPSERILKDEPMKKHTSFRIGGPADIMVLPANEEEIIHTLKVCKDTSVPIFIMGNGSNLLVRDKGIRGVVLKISENYSNIDIGGKTIKAQSGVLLSTLSRAAVRHSLKGLEFASGIPGTLGGAITMNAGAYGGEMKDVVVSVRCIDSNGKIHILDEEEMNFGYRTSCIQTTDLIVSEVDMVLEYGDQQESLDLMADLARRRREKQPLAYPSAGSTFKRPVGYYAGKLIQDCGLKGLRIGDAQISDLHAGFIINLGNATAQNVIDLIKKVQDIIYDKYGVEMVPEVRIVGEE
ncbi:MAG: UDP-N-acetylmuramate dehydrogenase [Caldicoprobacterales bacterium]|nr:UDP-N-acetylmuramate dehydrogenase [Clostridiales bacterium]